MNEDADRPDPSVLLAIYAIEGLDRVLYGRPAQWDGARFEMTTEDRGTLTLFDASVASQAEAKTALLSMDRLARRFAVALSWKVMRPVTARRLRVTVPTFSRVDTITTHSGIGFSDHAEAHLIGPPPDPPHEMPLLPVEVDRFVRTLAEAANFSDYVEEQLRRQYLVIEELWDRHQGQFTNQDDADRERIKLVRHFVSHATCEGAAVVALISAQLPSALVVASNKPSVQFDRSVEHRNFVARYEIRSRELAQKLVQCEIVRLRSVP